MRIHDVGLGRGWMFPYRCRTILAVSQRKMVMMSFHHNWTPHDLRFIFLASPSLTIMDSWTEQTAIEKPPVSSQPSPLGQLL